MHSIRLAILLGILMGATCTYAISPAPIPSLQTIIKEGEPCFYAQDFHDLAFEENADDGKVVIVDLYAGDMHISNNERQTINLSNSETSCIKFSRLFPSEISHLQDTKHYAIQFKIFSPTEFDRIKQTRGTGNLNTADATIKSSLHTFAGEFCLIKNDQGISAVNTALLNCGK